MRRLLLCLAAVCAAAPVQGQAQDVGERRRHNVQCLIALSFVAKTEGVDPAGVQLAGVFFAGQLFGVDPDVDLLTAAKAELLVLTPEKTTALLKECGEEMRARGKQLTEFGAALLADDTVPAK